MPLIDETGNTYTRLTVVEKSEQSQDGAMWICKCECGNEVIVKGANLRRGTSKSCGCLQKEIVADIGRSKRKYPREDRTRTYKLMSKYGITEDDYIEMLEQQDFKCLICGTEADQQNRALAVDHCHETGVVRGLLCQKCNIGIGHFNDDIQLLAKAIQYLQETK